MTTSAAPLSYGQELFWLLDRATPGLTAYNVPRAFRITGPLDAKALENALDGLIDRHEVLRSVYTLAGDHPIQTVLAAAKVPLELIDLSGLPAPRREEAVRRELESRVAHNFDLAQEIPVRATLFRLADDEHVFFLLTHHIVSDGWSKSITFRDLSELYAAGVAGRAPALPRLPMQFADYARAERAALTDGRLGPQLAYWREQLRGPLPELDLSADRTPGAIHSYEGRVREVVLPPALVTAMRGLGQSQGASLYMVLLAAYQTLLHRYSGQDEIIVGSPTAGRQEEETRELIGYFANALVLRTSFEGNPSFTTLLKRVVGTCLDAYENQDVPFEMLVLELQKGRQLTPAPLFRCVLTMEDTVPASLSLGRTRLEPIDVWVAGTKFDLTLLFAEVPEGLRLRLSYRTALFDDERIERMLGHLQTVLESAVADPAMAVGALRTLTRAEEAQLRTWNDTRWDEGTPATITALVETQARRVPSQVAVTGVDGSLTWEALNQRANAIAHWLAARQAGRGTLVGLCLDRSAAMIAGMLGILKSGSAYVPLVPDLPPARLLQQLRDSGAGIVVTTQGHAARFPAGTAMLCLDSDGDDLQRLPTGNPIAGGAPQDLAYILFTSGSTGVPKGVAVTHANLVHYTRAIAQRLGLDLAAGSPWHFATVSTLAADLGHTAVFPALVSGGTLHVLPASIATDPARFAEYLASHPLDLLKITPNHLQALLAGRDAGTVLPRRWIVLGGEACPWELADALAATGTCRVLNHYGPTETTVGVCTREVTVRDPGRSLSSTVPIGAALGNSQLHVLDRRGEPTPVGVAGELYVGGAGVAQGYWGQDALTRERFVPDPFSDAPSARLYRTGDRVRRLENGEIEFLGRADDQVKIRGFRVEPGELEAVLGELPGIRQVAVRAWPGDGGLRLAAYLSGEALPDDAALSAWAGDRLPDYMVPSDWVRLDQLPLTSNGKIDRRALPEPDRRSTTESVVQPRSTAEEALAALFGEVLKRESVGIHEDFFAMGGHSLLAIRLLGRISKTFGTRLPLRALFDAPTVAGLAALVDPTTPLQAKLTEIWREVLKRDGVGLDDNFFDLGGHSLLAIRALGRISKAAGVRLPLRALFDAPSVRKLAAVIESMQQPPAKTQEIDNLVAALMDLSPEERSRLLASSPDRGKP